MIGSHIFAPNRNGSAAALLIAINSEPSVVDIGSYVANEGTPQRRSTIILIFNHV